MLPPVVLDKSFLQGATRARVHELATNRRLLMTEALLYELLSKPEDYRACFSKFPSIDNPVELVPHVGGYFKKEIENHRPAPKPSARKLQVCFQFNPRLLNNDYQLPEEAANEIMRQRNELLRDVVILKERALNVRNSFPDLFVGSDAARKKARMDAEAMIAKPDALLDFYAGLKAPKGMRRYPPRRLVTDKWAIYRWLQVQFLFVIDLYLRYGTELASPMSMAVEERIEHDVLDAQYLLIGILEGAFATEERKLQRWFKLLQPNGLLLTETVKSSDLADSFYI